ncbi:MAG: DNA internalization-related competence protein ComEC/Rec2 [Bacillota bacterium]
MQRPMLYGAAAFTGGIVLAASHSLDRAYILAAVGLAGLLVPVVAFVLTMSGGGAHRSRRLSAAVLLLGLFCLGSLRWAGHAVAVRVLPLDEGEGRPAELVLSALTPPVPSAGGMRWEARVEHIHPGGLEVLRGREILVYSRDPVEPGRVYRAEGEISLPGSARNPANFDYRRHLLSRGIGYCVEVSRMDKVASRSGLLPSLGGALRRRILEGTEEVGEDARGLILALLLGHRDQLPDDLVDSFRSAGLGHLLAISGLHVMTFGLILLRLLRLVLPRRPALFCGVGAVFSYSALVGGGPSVSRAALLFAARTLAPEVARPYDPLNVLAASALLLTIHRPGLVFDAGFQMSFCACWALIVVRPVLERICGSFLAAAIAVYGTTLPLTLYHFQMSSPVALVANPLLIPVFVPVLACAWVAGVAAIGAVFTPLLAFAAVPVELFAGVVRQLGTLPGGAETGISLPLALFIYLTLICIFPAVRRTPIIASAGPLVPRGMRAARLLSLVVTWAVTLALIVTLPAAGAGLLRVAVFDVGQGDCILFEVPGGGVFMIDTGPAGWRAPSPLESRILPYLNSRGIGRIDHLLLTHGHLDHTGGTDALIREVGVDEVWVGPMCEGGGGLDCDEGLRDSLEGVQTRVRRVTAGDGVEVGGVEFTVLWPPADAPAYLDLNEISAAMMVRYGDWSMLNMADVESAGERGMVARYGRQLGATVLKAGHHGSGAASGATLLQCVRPELAVISVGSNSYGHPAAATLERLEGAGARAIVTRDAGAVIMETDGKVWRVWVMAPDEMPPARRNPTAVWGNSVDVVCF